MIDTILSNLGILILIVGGLMSVFKRQSDGSESKRKPVKVPTQRNMSPSSSSRKAESIPAQTMEHKEEKSLTGQLTSDLEKRYEEIRGRKQEKEDIPVPNNLSSTNKQKRRSKQKSFNRKKIVDGIIWSEVLGQPRAKRPYHPKRYK